MSAEEGHLASLTRAYSRSERKFIARLAPSLAASRHHFQSSFRKRSQDYKQERTGIKSFTANVRLFTKAVKNNLSMKFTYAEARRDERQASRSGMFIQEVGCEQWREMFSDEIIVAACILRTLRHGHIVNMRRDS